MHTQFNSGLKLKQSQTYNISLEGSDEETNHLKDFELKYKRIKRRSEINSVNKSIQNSEAKNHLLFFNRLKELKMKKLKNPSIDLIGEKLSLV